MEREHEMTLKSFLEKVNEDVTVCVKEPGKCAKFWTTLKNGASNIHTDGNLERKVYEIHTCVENGKTILGVYCW